MPAPIDFYFELSSPYSYLAARKIGDVAKLYDRAVHRWPIMLGVIFQTTQNRPLMEQPLKADYTDRDVRRVARDMGLPFAPPVAGFPFASHVGARAIYWAADQEEGADAAWPWPCFRRSSNAASRSPTPPPLGASPTRSALTGRLLSTPLGCRR